MAKIKKNVLSISLFQGWLRAYKIDRSGKEESWSAEKRVFKLDEIREALKEAVEATDSRGSYASIVIDHGQMQHKAIDLPPLTPKDLHLYLVRKVDQFKEFKEEAAFCYAKAYTKSRLFVSINYIPMSFIRELNQACTDVGLHLIQLIPLSKIRSQQFSKLPIAEDEVAVLVIKMFEEVFLLVGNKKGATFLERALKVVVDNKDDIERVVREVKRSILYNKQQFGQKVALLRMSERFGEEFYLRLNQSLNIPVEMLPKSPRFFWNKELLTTPFNDGNNLIRKKPRSEIRIRKHTKAAAFAVIALWIGAIAATLSIEYMVHQKEKLIFPLKKQISELQRSKEEWERRTTKLRQLRNTVKVMEGERLPPVPGWFLGHLCNELPNGLVLTRAQVEHKEDRWEVSIEGISTKENRETAEELKTFSNNLQNGPFKMRVSKDWYEDWVNQLKVGASGGHGTRKFSIGGVIQ